MCRNCPLPQWSVPIEVEVASLPVYFCKEQSWNFERLNFGNGTIVDTKDGKSARPSVTGLVGARLRDGFALKPHPRFPGGRYLLVSECLYCPGRRYGCTPRDNCTGKRRFCHALCKISIFADKPEAAFVYYSGTHGSGDVTSLAKHRPNKQMLGELRRLRVEEGLTPTQGYEWCKSYFSEHGMDEKLLPTKQQIKSLMKRASKARRQQNYKNESSESPAVPTTPSSGDMKYIMNFAENSEMANGSGSQFLTDSSASGNVTSVFNPGGTPISFGPRFQSTTSLLNSPVTSTNTVDKPVEKNICNMLGSPRSGVENEKDADKLKEFVRILQEENFNRMSQIADLQVEINNLKTQVLDLKEDNLKKAIHIAQLERERRTEPYIHSEQPVTTMEEAERADEEALAASLVENSEYIHNEQPVVENVDQREHARQETMTEGVDENDQYIDNEQPVENMEQPDEEHREAMTETLVENNEGTTVIIQSTEGMAPVSSENESLRSANSFQEALCDGTISVSIQNAGEIHDPSHVTTTLDSPVIVAQAIIVTQAVADDVMQQHCTEN